MTDDLFALGGTDVERIKRLLTEWEGGRLTADGAQGGKFQGSPLWTKMGRVKSSTAARSGLTPGSGTAQIYNVNVLGKLAPSPAGTDESFVNLWEEGIPANELVMLWRDPLSGGNVACCLMGPVPTSSSSSSSNCCTVTGCSMCSSGMPATWTLTGSGFLSPYDTLNGTFTMVHDTGCDWHSTEIVPGSGGTPAWNMTNDGSYVYITGNVDGEGIYFNLGEAGQPVFNCCGSNTLHPTGSSTGDTDGTIVLTPYCPGSSYSASSFSGSSIVTGCCPAGTPATTTVNLYNPNPACPLNVTISTTWDSYFGGYRVFYDGGPGGWFINGYLICEYETPGPNCPDITTSGYYWSYMYGITTPTVCGSVSVAFTKCVYNNQTTLQNDCDCVKVDAGGTIMTLFCAGPGSSSASTSASSSSSSVASSSSSATSSSASGYSGCSMCSPMAPGFTINETAMSGPYTSLNGPYNLTPTSGCDYKSGGSEPYWELVYTGTAWQLQGHAGGQTIIYIPNFLGFACCGYTTWNFLSSTDGMSYFTNPSTFPNPGCYGGGSSSSSGIGGASAGGGIGGE